MTITRETDIDGYDGRWFALDKGADEPAIHIGPGGYLATAKRNLAVLVVEPEEGGRATMAKLGIPTDTATAITIKGNEVCFYEPSYPGRVREDGTHEPGKVPGNRPLGPGLRLITKGALPIGWLLDTPQPDHVAPMPAHLLTVDAIPADEDEFSRGGLRRTPSTFEDTGTPEMLYGGLMLKTGVHVIVAGPGEGKSMSTTAIAAELMRRGYSVVYFDADGNGHRIFRRLASTGIDAATVDDRFFHYSVTSRIEREHFRYVLDRNRPALVVFDNLTNIFSRAGISEVDNVAVAGWFNEYPAKVRDEYGAAALILDHPSRAGNGKYARGAGSKLAEEDVSWTLTKVEKFDPGKVGKVKFQLQKDNDGAIPSETVSYRIGGTPCMFEPTTEKPLTDRQRAVLACLVDGATKAEWLKAARGDGAIDHNQKFSRDVEALEKAGEVEADEAGRFFPAS